MELPKIFDALTIPDAENFRSAANNLQSGHDLYQTYHQQLATGHTTLMTSWEGDACTQYSDIYQKMHQLQEDHQQHMQQASITQIGIAALLEAAQVAQDIAIGELAGAGIEFIAGFFTAGATDVLAAPEVGVAVETEAGAQASVATARTLLQTTFQFLMDGLETWKNRKLLFQAGGAAAGALSGLTFSLEHHESVGQTLFNVGNDAWMGYDVGKNLSSGNPLSALKTLGGLAFGTEQYATSNDKNNTDPFGTIAAWGLLTSGKPEGDKNTLIGNADKQLSADTHSDLTPVSTDNTPTTDVTSTSSGDGGEPDKVTYSRVQGGTPPNASRFRIFVNDDGSINIPNKKANLNVSVGTDHAYYFQSIRGDSTEVVQFDLPKWLDDLIDKSAIRQFGYRDNPANQGMAAPKVVDPTTPGRSYELPSP